MGTFRWGRWGEGASRYTTALLVKPHLIITAVLLAIFALTVPFIVIELNVQGIAYNVHSDSGHDFRLIYSAARVLWQHQNPYDPHTFAQQALNDGMPRRYLLRHNALVQLYVYPPICAWLVIPLTWLGLVQALFVWRVLTVALVMLGSYAMIRAWSTDRASYFASSKRCVILAAVITTSPLTAYVIYWGNPVVLVYTAIGGLVYALRKHTTRWDIAAGALMCVSLLKPQLAVPLAIIVVVCYVRGGEAKDRFQRIFLGFGIAVLVFLVLDFVVVPPSLLLAWPRSVAYLSGKLSLQPDMPSLYGMLKYFTPSAGNIGILPAIIVVLGGIVLFVLYRRLSATWRAASLVGLLSVVWCFATPYAHGNDEMLFIPGALTLGATIQAAFDLPLARAKTANRYQLFQMYTRLAISLAAFVALWLGPSILLIHFGSYNLPVSLAVVVAPLLILFAFLSTSSLHRHETHVSYFSAEEALSTA